MYVVCCWTYVLTYMLENDVYCQCLLNFTKYTTKENKEPKVKTNIRKISS